MKKAMVSLMLVAASFSLMIPAKAELPSIVRWCGAVLENATTDETIQVTEGVMRDTKFTWKPALAWSPEPLQMKIKVIPIGGGSFGGFSLADKAREVQSILQKNSQDFAPGMNIALFDGDEGEGDYVMECPYGAISSKDINENSDFLKDFEKWRNSIKASSSATSDSRQWTGVHVFMHPTIYLVGKNGRRYIVSAPSAPIAASDSELVSSEVANSAERRDEYSSRGHVTASEHAVSEKKTFRNDVVAANTTMLNGLLTRLGRKAVVLTLEGLSDYIRNKARNQAKAQEAAKQAVPEAQKENAPEATKQVAPEAPVEQAPVGDLEYTVEQDAPPSK